MIDEPRRLNGIIGRTSEARRRDAEICLMQGVRAQRKAAQDMDRAKKTIAAALERIPYDEQEEALRRATAIVEKA